MTGKSSQVNSRPHTHTQGALAEAGDAGVSRMQVRGGRVVGLERRQEQRLARATVVMETCYCVEKDLVSPRKEP